MMMVMSLMVVVEEVEVMRQMALLITLRSAVRTERGTGKHEKHGGWAAERISENPRSRMNTRGMKMASCYM